MKKTIIISTVVILAVVSFVCWKKIHASRRYAISPDIIQAMTNDIEKIANDQTQAFFSLVKLIDNEDFIRNSKLEPSCAKEINIFLKEFEITEDISNGYLHDCMGGIEELGFLKVLDESFNASQQTSPVLLVKEGYLPHYGNVPLDFLLLERYLFYFLVYNLDRQNNDVFWHYMPEIINGEKILNIASDNTLRFLDSVIQRYKWSEKEMERLQKMKQDYISMQERHKLYIKQIKEN